MSYYVSFPSEKPSEPIEDLVMNLVDPATDAGAVARLISQALSAQHGDPAGLFDVDPLVDYRAVRPWLNYKNGHLAGMWRDGILLSHARDMEGKEFLHLHGQEPDFHWDALVSDMLDVVERFGVRNVYSFTAIGSLTPHTRPADMLVRSRETEPDSEVLQADFWFQSSFADYLEYQASRLDLHMTNIAVRVPMYLAAHHYSAGAAGALNMVTSLSGLRLPVGDLEQDASRQQEELVQLMAQNDDLAGLIHGLEKDYDDKGGTPGFVSAPQSEFVVPSLDEIGRAAEQFLAQMGDSEELYHRRDTGAYNQEQYDPQGLLRRINELRDFDVNTAGPSRPFPRSPGGAKEAADSHDVPDTPTQRTRRRGRHSFPTEPENTSE